MGGNDLDGEKDSEGIIDGLLKIFPMQNANEIDVSKYNKTNP